jgi:4-hydroxybenzoate polyprenyltransferase
VSDRTPISVAIAAIKQLRPKQWIKNGLLYAALIFSGKFVDDFDAFVAATIGFAAFCMISSSGYVFNDIVDREADRKHPKKKFRPIASGALPVPLALVLAVVLLISGLGVAWSLSLSFAIVAFSYLATTMSYSFYLKNLVIFDVMFLSSGFVWRAIAGAVAIGVTISLWLFLVTAFFALFIGFNKRYAELKQLGSQAQTRKNLAEYSLPMIEKFQSVVTANVVLCYALYTVLGPNPWMVVTVPVALYVIFRYIYLVEKGGGGAPVETLVKDPPLLVSVVVYGVLCVGVMWLHFEVEGLLPNILPEHPLPGSPS